MPFVVLIAVVNMIRIHENAVSPKTETSELEHLSVQNSSYKNLPRIAVKYQNEIHILQPDEIIWIKAEGNYAKINTKQKSFLKRTSLIKMEKILNSGEFIRIHKSYLINLNYLEKMEPHFHGDFVVTLNGGVQLSCSRNYANRLTSSLK